MQKENQDREKSKGLEAALKLSYSDTTSRRERLMEAAKHIMAEIGYERAPTNLIAREAGTSENELLQLFHSKLQLLEAIFNEAWDPINSRLTEVVLDSVSTRQAMISILATVLKVFNKDTELARLLLFESRRQHGNNSEIRQSKGFRDFLAILMKVVERGQKDGTFTTAIRPPVVASALLGAAEGMIRDRVLASMLREPEPFSESDLRIAFEAVVSGFRS